MSLKVVFHPSFFRHTLLLLFLFILGSNSAFSQCAGNDAAITVCNVQDVSSKSIDLFALLGPGAVTGGTWTDPAETTALDLATGILNAWDILNSGVYTFTYTVSEPGCVDTSSDVVVTIGGYAGVPSPQGSACSDDSSVNLFQFFVGTNVPSPQFNGVWTDNDNTGALSGSIFNATATGFETYSFTYTVPAIGSCPISQSTVFVRVYRKPEPGVPIPLNFCENDDFSTYTNVNLMDYLSNEDTNGKWTEASGTTEFSSPTDTFINVQNIFNTKGPGEYYFNYTVLPVNPVCTPKTATVALKIIKLIDLTGGSVVVSSDICADKIGLASFQAVVTQGIKPVPDGVYTINYSISGPNSVPNIVASVTFENGIAAFNLSPDDVNQVGTYTITITAIKLATDPGICNNIAGISGVLHIFPLPNIDNADLNIDPICQNSNGIVEVTGIATLPPGNYQLTYTIVGANPTAAQTVNITSTGGNVTFNIPAALVPNIGNSTLILSKIVNLTTGCVKPVNILENFIVRPLPDLSNLAISVNNVCQNQPATVSVSGLGSMTNVSILYNLTGANTVTGQSVALTAVAGSGSFSIPGTLLPNFGLTQIDITVVINSVTTCSSPANTSDVFVVNQVPNAANVGVTINDVCQNQPVSVQLSGLDNTPSVTVSYTLSGANTATQSTIVVPSSGAASFVIPANLLPNTGTTVLTINSVGNSLTNCPSPLNVQESFAINPLPNPTAFTVNIPNVCQNQPVSVLFSNLGALTSLTFTYNLSGANSATNQTETIAVTAGSGIYTIPAAAVPNTGTTTMSIVNVSNPITNCSIASALAPSFTINPLPNPVVMSVAIPDACKNQPVAAVISGLGNVTTASITYDLSGANTSTGQTGSLTISAGSAIFTIPSALLPNTGDTTFSITNLTYTQSNCSIPVTTVFDVFTIRNLPIAPTVSNLSFCKAQNATVANLVPNGAQYSWYASDTATTALAPDTLLASGNYYVSEISPVTNCSSPRAMLSVTIVQLAAPVLNSDGENFCGANNPTLQDLTNNTTVDEDVVWYDAPQNGNALPNTQLLEEGGIYYGFQFSDSLGCLSENGVSVKVSLTDCDDDDDDDFFIPDGFSPNGDTVNDTFKIPDIEFLYPDFNLEIYNRYGALIFKGNKFKPSWDGYSSQSGNVIDGIAPNGVYFYVINFNKNNKSPKQGRLYLNR